MSAASSMVPEVGLELSLPPVPSLNLLRRAKASPNPRVVSRALRNPPSSSRGRKPLGRLQLQIRTLTERLYQLGTGEKESFRHARERASVSRNTGLGVRFYAPPVWLVWWVDSITSYYLVCWLFGLLSLRVFLPFSPISSHSL